MSLFIGGGIRSEGGSWSKEGQPRCLWPDPAPMASHRRESRQQNYGKSFWKDMLAS